ncbi:Inositol-1,4,5-trisphosphate 5-phosphatase 2 [Vanrija pseudolonga]|uniref:Inositol-1,4,5-trisphosphate 5-phosphatase 2 n=1 Tax=Vanrija pseudolonga TaxID=143232 RepID=A0AAF0XZK5_9TREE|nr:Inositol-1,4,5-trisphosphate 5-phosphatase 2 [Vanrija pseudolonga]
MAQPLSVFLTTFNTGLQGSKAQEQDLSSWLIPGLQNAELAPYGATPDIYAVAVQELLPLHLAFSGLSGPVLNTLSHRMENILSQHATSLSKDGSPDTYHAVAKIAHVGVALWVFARDKTTAGRLGRAETSSVGLWRFGLGNKAAVGVRLPVQRGANGGGWETLTFVSTHLEAHDHNIGLRNEQYEKILSSLIFTPQDGSHQRLQPFHTSHLFIMGDLNYRLSRLPRSTSPGQENGEGRDAVKLQKERADCVAYDTLKKEQSMGRAFGFLREGDLTGFAPTYKRIPNEVEGYSKKRIPGWTDRIFFSSHTDPVELYEPNTPAYLAPATTTQIIQFDSSPEVVFSDHKPVHAVLILPPVQHNAQSPLVAPVIPEPPSNRYRVRPQAIPEDQRRREAIIGHVLDRLIGFPWLLIVILGFGNVKHGGGVAAFLILAYNLYRTGIFMGAASP